MFILFFLTNIWAQTTITSHKGIWSDHVYPQNTLKALSLAVEKGFRAVEFDVQFKLPPLIYVL